jgi:RHS repeat-associated protein
MVGGSTGSNETFAYDPNSGRMTQWQSSNSYVNKSQTGTLTWNGNGTLQKLNVADTYNPTDTQNCAYGYDDLARLASANCGTTIMNQNFGYDIWGNITKTVPTGSTGYAYNPTYDSHNHASTSQYDSDGNTTSEGLNSYTYDAEGRPVSVNGTQIIYDAFSRAVEYNNGSSHTQVVYDPQGGKLAFMSGQTLQMYALPLAGGVQAVFNSSGLWYYRHADWLGSTRLALDTGGNLYVARNYAPFGETYGGAGSGDNNRMFTGQTQDLIIGPTGVYDFLFRQHSTAQGRWLVPDPAGLAAVDLTNPQTWNRYAYVANNPMSNVDPLGLDGEPSVPWGSPFCGGDPIACALGGWDVCIWAGLCSGGGSSGGSNDGGTQPSQSPSTPPSTPPSNPPNKPINFPTETNGMPRGLSVNFGGPLGAILPSAICGDMGPCPTIGDGFQAQAAVLPWAAPCLTNPVCLTAMVVGTVAVAGYEGYKYFSKGGRQNILPSWAEGQRPLPGESASDFADRVCKAHYPPNGAGCGSGPGSERSKIQKWARDKFGI